MLKHPAISETELIQKCKNGDLKYQERLYKHFYGYAMGVGLRYLPNKNDTLEVVNDAFIKVFKSIAKFDQESLFKPWFRKIIVNTALKYVQKKKIVFGEVNDYSEQAPRIDAYAYSNLGEEEILKLVQQLPEGYKLVFNLSVIEGYNHDEISKILKIQPGTSRSQLVKARKMLQNQIVNMQKIAV